MSVPEESWIADEVHRANHIAGVVFEGCVALAAAAAVTAFQLDHKARWVAAGLLWNLLRETQLGGVVYPWFKRVSVSLFKPLVD